MFEIERLPVVGNSMNLVGIQDGDVIAVRAQETAPHGAVVVVRLEDDQYTVKRLAVVQPPGRRAQFWLVPESTDPGHQVRRMGRHEAIVGMVLGIPLRDLSARIPRQRPRPDPFRGEPQQRPANRTWLESLHRRNVWPVLSRTFAPPPPDPEPAPAPAPRHDRPQWGRSGKPTPYHRVPRFNPWAPQPRPTFPLPLNACSGLDFLRVVPVEDDAMAGRGIRAGDEAGIYPMERNWWRDGVIVYVDLARYGLGRRLMQLGGDGYGLWVYAVPTASPVVGTTYAIEAAEVLGYVRNTRPRRPAREPVLAPV